MQEREIAFEQNGGQKLSVRVNEKGEARLVQAVRVGAGWLAEMNLTLQRGRLVVSFLRLGPEAPEQGLQTLTPVGGITMRLLRQVPIHSAVRALTAMLRTAHGRDRLEGLVGGTPAEVLLTSTRPSTPADPGKPRRGRRPISTELLLEVASAYSKATNRGSKQPVVDAAKQLRLTPARVRDLVHRARQPEHALLSLASWGRGEGELTERAKALLKRAKRRRR